MKLADRAIEVHSIGVRSSNQFNIAQTSKMFNILSNSLYSDKVMAVIRELSTNAYDSHVSAGNKNPFKVTLPTYANPNFTVRDYGTGLSQNNMESLYTTYGASNKNDSNDFVGCLGLGSKSPFAYTQSFTTTSYYNGMKYTYVAAIDDNGVPTLNLFHSCETDEPNGLEISFAVKQYDFPEFSSKAIRIFHYFKMKPIIEGGVIPSLKDHSYSNKNIVISGDGWRVCRLANSTNHYPSVYHKIDSGIVAIMGNIAYPVNVTQLVGEQKAEQPDHIAKWNRAFGKADIASWKSFITEILNQNLYLELDFSIGELEMDVSREGLQYTKAVIKTLREKTQDIYLEMREEFSKKIEAAKTKIEAITTYYQLNDLAGGWGVGASWKDANGKVHDINRGEDLEYKIPSGKSLYVFNYRSAGYRSRRMIYLTNKLHFDTLTSKGEYRYGGIKTGPLSFFVCDIKSEETAKKIVTRYCNDKDCFAYLMVDTKDSSKSNEGFDQLIEDVGSHNIMKVSDYKDLIKNNNPRKVGTRSSKGSVSDQDVFFIYGASKDSGSLTVEYNDAQYLKTLTSDELEAFDDSHEIVYIPITRYASNEGEGEDLPNIKNLYDMFNHISLKDFFKKLFGDTKIYAIKNSIADKMVESGDHTMIPFNTFFKDRLKNVGKNYFKNAFYINDIVKFCSQELGAKDPNYRGYHASSYGDSLNRLCYHILNFFGLDYARYINNTNLIYVIDNYLIMEFFSITMQAHKYDIGRFKEIDYYAHINTLLSKAGIDSVDAHDISKTNNEYNQLNHFITNIVYSDPEEYMSLIKSSDKIKHKLLPKASDLIDIMSKEIDNNPTLKYIMVTVDANRGIRGLSSNNPIANSIDYYTKSHDWLCKMSDDMIDLLRVQLSSIIK